MPDDAVPTEGPPALARARWPMLDGRRPLLLVPIGSLEQHGPHLPLSTDTIVAAAVVREVVRLVESSGRDVLVAPAIGYGVSGEHQDFPGTISIGRQALELLLVEYCRSACLWAEGVIFVNGHGGNVDTLTSAVERLRCEGRAVAWTACVVPDADAHAGHTETSLLRYIAPWSVRIDLAVAGCTDPAAELLPRLRREGVRAVSESGVLGDATNSTVEEGRRAFTAMVNRVVQELSDIDVGARGRLRPPQPRRRAAPTRSRA